MLRRRPDSRGDYASLLRNDSRSFQVFKFSHPRIYLGWPFPTWNLSSLDRFRFNWYVFESRFPVRLSGWQNAVSSDLTKVGPICLGSRSRSRTKHFANVRDEIIAKKTKGAEGWAAGAAGAFPKWRTLLTYRGEKCRTVAFCRAFAFRRHSSVYGSRGDER